MKCGICGSEDFVDDKQTHTVLGHNNVEVRGKKCAGCGEFYFSANAIFEALDRIPYANK